MKHLIGYSSWSASREMLLWVLTGIRQTFDPDSVEVVFYMDGYEPAAADSFRCTAAVSLCGYKLDVYHSREEIRNLGCHRFILNELRTRRLDSAIIADDDLRFNDLGLIGRYEAILASYADRMGVVGMRVGYDYGMQGMCSSPFDAKTATPKPVREIPVGEHVEVKMVNPGPIGFPLAVLERLGLPDSRFNDWHWWNDYALQAHHAGLRNVLLGINAEHRKFGECRPSNLTHDPNGWEPADRKLLNDKWLPVVGHNVI